MTPARRMTIGALALLALAQPIGVPALAAPPPAEQNTAEIKAIEAACYDYVDGQLEGDPARVARALHPDLAKRAARPATQDEPLALRRMTKDELVALTRQGVIKTPRNQWQRSVRVLDIAGNAAVARVETPWFIDYFHLGRWGDRWVIVNALYYPKPRAD